MLLLELARLETRLDDEAVDQVNLQETPEGSHVQLDGLLTSFLCMGFLLAVAAGDSDLQAVGSRILSFMAHLETPLATSLDALTTVVSVAFVTHWVNSPISTLPLTTRSWLTRALVITILALLLCLRPNGS